MMMLLWQQGWFINGILDRSDLPDNSYEVFRGKLQEADVSELAPYFVSNHICFALFIYCWLTGLLCRIATNY